MWEEVEAVMTENSGLLMIIWNKGVFAEFEKP